MLVPDRVAKLIDAAPWPPTSAPPTAVVIVTASIASCRGVTIAKNPSVDLLKLSLLLTPSSVMLMNDCGRPLIVASRLMPDVFTPGRNVTAFNALREAIGILLIWSTFRVEEIVAVCVLMISLLLATTTDSVSAPISSVAFAVAGEPSCTRTSLTTAVLNPVSVTVTV